MSSMSNADRKVAFLKKSRAAKRAKGKRDKGEHHGDSNSTAKRAKHAGGGGGGGGGGSSSSGSGSGSSSSSSSGSLAGNGGLPSNTPSNTTTAAEGMEFLRAHEIR